MTQVQRGQKRELRSGDIGLRPAGPWLSWKPDLNGIPIHPGKVSALPES